MFVPFLGRLNVLVPARPKTFGQDVAAAEPASTLEAQDEIAGRPRRPAVSVDERMNAIQPPENVCGKLDGLGAVPTPVHQVREIVHQSVHAPMFGRSPTGTGHGRYSPAFA